MMFSLGLLNQKIAKDSILESRQTKHSPLRGKLECKQEEYKRLLCKPLEERLICQR